MEFLWQEKYEMGIKEIDDQHRYFVGLINELRNSILNKQTEKSLIEILDRIIDYASLHFYTEEKYMDAFHYEKVKEHKEKHKQMKETLSRFKDRLYEDKTALAFELKDFLRDWLDDHLVDTDFDYMNCFKSHGLK